MWSLLGVSYLANNSQIDWTNLIYVIGLVLQTFAIIYKLLGSGGSKNG